MSAPAETKLEPCPWCNKALIHVEASGGGENFWRHPMDDCVAADWCVRPDQVAAWNLRTPAAPDARDAAQNAAGHVLNYLGKSAGCSEFLEVARIIERDMQGALKSRPASPAPGLGPLKPGDLADTIRKAIALPLDDRFVNGLVNAITERFGTSSLVPLPEKMPDDFAYIALANWHKPPRDGAWYIWDRLRSKYGRPDMSSVREALVKAKACCEKKRSDLPCRVDEMQPREQEIFKVAAEWTGALTFVHELIDTTLATLGDGK